MPYPSAYEAEPLAALALLIGVIPANGAVIQFPTPAMTPQISRWSDFADSPRR